MGIDVEIASGDSASVPDASAIAAFLGVSENGDGSVYRFLPGDNVQATLGDGPDTENVLSHLRNSGVECLYAGAAKTDGAISAVIHAGTGPTVTASGTPLNALTIRAKVATAGANGVGVIDVALDGASYNYSYIIPDESTAVLVGTVDVSAFTYPYSGLDTKHLDFTDPAAAVVTFSGALASPQAIADQFNDPASASTYGSESSDEGAFPRQLADGDTFIGAVDQGSPVTSTIVANPAILTLTGGSYAAGGAGDSVTFHVVVMGYPVITVLDLSAVGNTEADYIAALSTIPGLSAVDDSGDIVLTTDQKGSEAAATIRAYGGGAAAKLGGGAAPVPFVLASGSNVPNVDLVTETDFAAAVTFTGSTMIADTVNHSVTWKSNVAGASPKGVEFTGGTGVSKIAGFDNLEHNGLGSGGSLAVRAELKQDSAGHQYLRLYSTSKGASVTVTIDTTASDADSVLGFAGAGATGDGAAATLALPHTGVTLTFPAGTYPLNDLYSLTATGPRASVSAFMAAADNLRSWCQTNNRSFGVLVCAQAWDTTTNARAFVDARDAKIATWSTAANSPIFPYGISATTLHSIGTSPSSNAENIAANDTAVIAAFNTPGNVHVSNHTVAHGDCYMTGSSLFGKFRKTAVLPLAARRAAKKLSADPGDGAAKGLPECSLVHPDGITEARDETRSTNQVHMSGSTGPGFTTLGTKGGTPRVMRGVTRAGQSSRFVDMGVIAPTLRAVTVLHAAAESLENGTYFTNASGKLTDGERESLNTGLTSELRANVFEEPNSYFSSAVASLDSAEVIAGTRNLTIAATLQELGQGENISIKVSTVGILVLTAGS